MKKLQKLALVLSVVLILSILSACGAAEPASNSAGTAFAASSQDASPQEQAALPAGENAPSASESEATLPEAASALTGAIISQEECALAGYDVQYGMYDFETAVALPLTEDEESFSYWLMVAPYMLAYGDVDLESATFFSQMEQRTGIHMDVQAVSVLMASDSFSLMIASEDYTDLMEGVTAGYTGGASQMLEEEILIDLSPYVEDYMPNYQAWMNFDSSMCASVQTLDGQIPVAASIASDPWNVGPQIRSDWLKSLNLASPVTYDDYHEVLTAFKSEFGATMWLPNNGSPRSCGLSAGYDTLVNDNAINFRVIDGVVEYCPMTEDYADYIELMNQWYQEGLIYPDFAVQADSMDSGLVLNGTVGLWFSDVDTMTSFQGMSDDISIDAAAMARKSADQVLHMYAPDTATLDGTAISTACDDPELVCQWLDYLYTYDGTLLINYGVEGEGMMFDSDGSPCYTDLVLNNPDGMITVACSLVYSKTGGAGIYDATRYNASYNEQQLNAIALWTDNVDNTHMCPTNITLTPDESSTIATLMADIQTYVKQMSLSFISGTASPTASWDAFYEALGDMDVNSVVEIYQTAYDRYQAAMGSSE